MRTRLRIAPFVILGVLGFGLLTACMGDDNNSDEPTQTPIVIVPTETASPNDTEPTVTTAAAIQPTNTPSPTATDEPAPTLEPSPTPSPTRELMPTPTRAPIVTPTPTPAPVSSGGIQIPDDLLSVLPTLDDVPTGMVIVDEGEAVIEDFASDFEDTAAREQQLRDWGYQNAVFREMELAEDQVVDPASQPIAMIFRAMLLGSPENAQTELNSLVDQAILTDPDVDAVEEVAIDPIGDLTRAVRATLTTDDGTPLNVAFVGVTAGPFSLQFIAASGAQYDPMPDMISAAQASMDYLGYGSFPVLGEVLLETDFSNWVTGEYESGALVFGEDGYYHVIVDQGGGSFVSAYSTDHEPFTDIAVSVDMQMLSGFPAAQGCVMARVDSVNQQYDYALCIDGAGNVEALYEQFDADGNYTSEPLIPSGTVTVPLPVGPEGELWTTLTILTRGEEFWFVIDGEVVGTARHTGPPSGAVGIIVNNYDSESGPPAEFAFTNLVVEEVK